MRGPAWRGPSWQCRPGGHRRRNGAGELTYGGGGVLAASGIAANSARVGPARGSAARQPRTALIDRRASRGEIRAGLTSHAQRHGRLTGELNISRLRGLTDSAGLDPFSPGQREPSGGPLTEVDMPEVGVVGGGAASPACVGADPVGATSIRQPPAEPGTAGQLQGELAHGRAGGIPSVNCLVERGQPALAQRRPSCRGQATRALMRQFRTWQVERRPGA